MTPRAPALAPAQRRSQILSATLPLLLEHGQAVTTKQIAEAAGVAEGTIFRVFDTKEALVTAAVTDVFDLAPYAAELAAIEPAGTLREDLTRLVEHQQARFQRLFGLMKALGLMAPVRGPDHEEWEARIAGIQHDLLAPHADSLRVPVADLVRYTRLVTFAGSNPLLTRGHLLTASEIVALVLDGTSGAPRKDH